MVSHAVKVLKAIKTISGLKFRIGLSYAQLIFVPFMGSASPYGPIHWLSRTRTIRRENQRCISKNFPTEKQISRQS